MIDKSPDELIEVSQRVLGGIESASYKDGIGYMLQAIYLVLVAIYKTLNRKNNVTFSPDMMKGVNDVLSKIG